MVSYSPKVNHAIFLCFKLMGSWSLQLQLLSEKRPIKCSKLNFQAGSPVYSNPP